MSVSLADFEMHAQQTSEVSETSEVSAFVDELEARRFRYKLSFFGF